MVKPISSVKVLADMFDVSPRAASYCSAINGKLETCSAFIEVMVNVNKFFC